MTRRSGRLVGIFVAIAVAGCGGERSDPDPTPDGGTPEVDAGGGTTAPFRLLTWNAHDVYDEVDDADNPYDPVPTTAEVEAKLESLAQVLRGVDPDFIALMEIEHKPLLDRLADDHLAELGYTERGLIEAGDVRGIDVGFLSRVPVELVVSHAGERFPGADGTGSYTFARDALEVVLNRSGARLLVVVCHLRSRRDGTEADAHRLAEALEVRRIVDRRIGMGADRIAVVGDLNDEPTSPALAALLNDGALVDLTMAVPAAERWTFVFEGMERQYDYILVTPKLASEANASEVRIVHDAEAMAASDHAPVTAAFELAVPGGV